MANAFESVSLRSLQEIPETFRPLFASYPCFNRVQSAVFDDIIQTNSSLVITAPTGSGKTVVFELAILKLLMNTHDPLSLKIVYVAPVKALCNERYNDWQPKFQPYNLSVIEVTGDSQDHSQLQDHQIIITTPEKWDSLTRRWRDNVGLVQLVKLIMIDEVHLLNDPKRGPILETIVCRMKTVMRVLKLNSDLRFIAVSATIYNIEDLAKWLGTHENDYKFFRFGHEVRPVTLNRIVKGYPQSKSPYLFDIQLSYKLKSIIMDHGKGKPTLIFCSTRRGVVQTCKTLMDTISFNFTREQINVLTDVSDKLSDGKLREFVKMGGAYHHAGLAYEDRLLIQKAFADGILPVLVATSTLAMGVNLPAHLVIIKSTHQYIAGRIIEYPESSILQMVGRAGRPQFDTTATAVIMTKMDLVKKYQNLLDCKEVIESSLHLQLPEQLNAEIVLLTIFDLSVAMQWIHCTFLYLRALKNPKHYGLSGNENKIEKDLETMVLRAINALKRSQLVEMNENGLDLSPTPYGRLMSHYYINFNTFQLFFQISDLANVKHLIEILSNSNELSEIQLRINDRRPLNELNVNKKLDTIRFKLDGKIKTRELKINCLVQACLGCLTMDPTLQQESIRIINILERITKCLTEFLLRKNSYCSLLSSIILSKCLHAKLWENSPFVARQLDRIGATLGATLVACGKVNFNTILESHPQELERIVNRAPPFGNSVIEQVKHLPMYSLTIQVERKSVLNFTLHIKISILNRDLIMINNTAGSNHSFILLVGDTNNRLLLHKRVFDENILSENFTISLEINPPMPQKAIVHVISEQWVGIDLWRDVFINPMATVVVGPYCYLPGNEKNTKKNKVDEVKKAESVKEKKKKSDNVLKDPVKPKRNPLQNSPKIVEKVCSFDLMPDWMKNTPEIDENDFIPNVELTSNDLIRENKRAEHVKSLTKLCSPNFSNYCSFDLMPSSIENTPEILNNDGEENKENQEVPNASSPIFNKPDDDFNDCKESIDFSPNDTTKVNDFENENKKVDCFSKSNGFDWFPYNDILNNTGNHIQANRSNENILNDAENRQIDSTNKENGNDSRNNIPQVDYSSNLKKSELPVHKFEINSKKVRFDFSNQLKKTNLPTFALNGDTSKETLVAANVFSSVVPTQIIKPPNMELSKFVSRNAHSSSVNIEALRPCRSRLNTHHCNYNENFVNNSNEVSNIQELNSSSFSEDKSKINSKFRLEISNCENFDLSIANDVDCIESTHSGYPIYNTVNSSLSNLNATSNHCSKYSKFRKYAKSATDLDVAPIITRNLFESNQKCLINQSSTYQDKPGFDSSQINKNFDKFKPETTTNNVSFDLSSQIIDESNQDVSQQILSNDTSWQVTEILTPLDLSIAKPPKTIVNENKPKLVESLLSQMLPQDTLSITQTINPLDTSINWEKVEQSLISSSQSRKLSTLQDRFSYSKPSCSAKKPFSNYKSITPNEYKTKQFNKENVPSLKSLFAVAQAANRLKNS